MLLPFVWGPAGLEWDNPSPTGLHHTLLPPSTLITQADNGGQRKKPGKCQRMWGRDNILQEGACLFSVGDQVTLPLIWWLNPFWR